MTFSLEGFTTVRREGIELEANFTASVNADMRVGGLEESITVSGAAPKPSRFEQFRGIAKTKLTTDELMAMLRGDD